MTPRFFKTLWGHAGPIREAARQAAEAGFDGLEGPFPAGREDRAAFLDALGAFDLDYIAEISATGFATPHPGATVGDQLDVFERLLDAALDAEPLFFTTMAGSDLWPFAASVDFLTRAHAMAGDRGVRIGFETHRSRSLYHPVRTQELLAELPPIELTIDFSHWCVVTERLVLDELPDVLALCADRALHIQPRIGYDQGAQVPDPRAPEYAAAVEAHLRWWRALWEGQRRRGLESVTMTPEFGPDGYLQCEPFTQRPVADLWELNVWTAGLLRREFSRWLNAESAVNPG
ncbi:MAG: TIM barrel protein [Terrimicrobiaceae bacterium]|nr:TIM barrel protein [Terrimicrobiaceae bacterium]